jgi:acetolactate decarboxylase
MKTRSVPPQHKPYPPLIEASKQQHIFDLKNVAGTIVGFRCPAYMKSLNVTGYHLHFLANDLKTGGHTLDFVITGGEVEIDTCDRFVMLLPTGDASFNNADLKKDRGAELEKVEKLKQ